MEDFEKDIIQINKKANSLANIENLIIPIPEGFEVIREDIKDPNLIFLAQSGNFVEQLLTDGELDEEENFEDRIQKLIDETSESIRGNILYSDERFMTYYRTYSNDIIEFNVYIQDILSGTLNNKILIRQLNAYFLEPMGREVCQLSIASGPYDANKEKLLNSITNYKEDPIIKNLDNILNPIMENLVYRDDIEE